MKHLKILFIAFIITVSAAITSFAAESTRNISFTFENLDSLDANKINVYLDTNQIFKDMYGVSFWNWNYDDGNFFNDTYRYIQFVSPEEYESLTGVDAEEFNPNGYETVIARNPTVLYPLIEGHTYTYPYTVDFDYATQEFNDVPQIPLRIEYVKKSTNGEISQGGACQWFPVSKSNAAVTVDWSQGRDFDESKDFKSFDYIPMVESSITTSGNVLLPEISNKPTTHIFEFELTNLPEGALDDLFFSTCVTGYRDDALNAVYFSWPEPVTMFGDDTCVIVDIDENGKGRLVLDVSNVASTATLYLEPWGYYGPDQEEIYVPIEDPIVLSNYATKVVLDAGAESSTVTHFTTQEEYNAIYGSGSGDPVDPGDTGEQSIVKDVAEAYADSAVSIGQDVGRGVADVGPLLIPIVGALGGAFIGFKKIKMFFK